MVNWAPEGFDDDSVQVRLGKDLRKSGLFAIVEGDGTLSLHEPDGLLGRMTGWFIKPGIAGTVRFREGRYEFDVRDPSQYATIATAARAAGKKYGVSTLVYHELR